MAELGCEAEREVEEAEEVYLDQIGELVRLRCRWDASRQLREALETARGEELARLTRVSRLVELKAASLKRGVLASVQPRLEGQPASSASGKPAALCAGPRRDEGGNAPVEVLQLVPAPLAVAAANKPALAAAVPELPTSNSLTVEKQLAKRQHLQQLKLRLAKLQRTASSQAASPRAAGGKAVLTSPGARGSKGPTTPRLRAIAAGGPEADAVDRALQRFLLTGKKAFSPPGASPKDAASGGTGGAGSEGSGGAGAGAAGAAGAAAHGAGPPELSIGSSSNRLFQGVSQDALAAEQGGAPRAADGVELSAAGVDASALGAFGEDALRATSKSPVVLTGPHMLAARGLAPSASITSNPPAVVPARTPSPSLAIDPHPTPSPFPAPHAPAVRLSEPLTSHASPERSSAPSPGRASAGTGEGAWGGAEERGAASPQGSPQGRGVLGAAWRGTPAGGDGGRMPHARAPSPPDLAGTLPSPPDLVGPLPTSAGRVGARATSLNPEP
ncbi:hypothetical protein T484DRAFT_1922234 [Baffinella frigidus]|nr:hypothetical protein T484DRAFT_1922234 [Cryptophyta sp. CCMP2293]